MFETLVKLLCVAVVCSQFALAALSAESHDDGWLFPVKKTEHGEVRGRREAEVWSAKLAHQSHVLASCPLMFSQALLLLF